MNSRILAVAVTLAGVSLLDLDAGEAQGVTTEKPASPAPGQALGITREGPMVNLNFTGTLQWAANVAGPWTSLPDATSPYTEAFSVQSKFYRSAELVTNSIFASRSVVAFTLTGPFQEHFALAFAGMPDGIFPPVRLKPYFDGKLTLGTLEIPVDLRVRGNSSLQECPFPKLKFKVSSEDRAGTPFFDAREIKVGTHCAEGGSGTVGRLRDERAAYREALAYELVETLGYIGPRIRRARITYHDTSPPGEPREQEWPVTRSAMILDDIEVVAERLGGRALDDEEISDLKEAGFDEVLIAELHLFHAFLGNWDYALSLDGEELWNTDVVKLPNGQYIPVPGDFDLASFVTGEVRLAAPWDYRADLPDLERQVLYRLEQLRQQAGEPIFLTASDRLLLHRPAIEAQISAAEVDTDGKTIAQHHVKAFYDALAAVRGQ